MARRARSPNATRIDCSTSRVCGTTRPGRHLSAGEMQEGRAPRPLGEGQAALGRRTRGSRDTPPLVPFNGDSRRLFVVVLTEV